MTSFSLLAPAIARDVLDHALALGADFAELFVERKRRSQLSLLSSQIENISGGLDFGIGVRLCYGHKVLYGYTNLASRDELLRIVSLLAAKDKRDPVVTATAFDFTPSQTAIRWPCRSRPTRSWSRRLPICMPWMRWPAPRAAR